VHGYDTWVLVEEDLIGIAYLQFPWSALAMDLAGAALDAVEPDSALTYAEAGGWGRALVLEARRRGIPIAGLQHGFISRHWLNYLHEPDEIGSSLRHPVDRGFPYPDRTLVYDGFTAHHLVESGHLPSSTVVVTGNPRLDELIARATRMTDADRAEVRRKAGAAPEQHLVVLAIKYRDRYKPFLDALLGAVAATPAVYLAMKPHPADSIQPYERLAAKAANAGLVAAESTLVELTASARLLVTVNSTAAIEAMVLGVPALALALPNYLSPFVDAGAMAGVTRPGEIAGTFAALIGDQQRRGELAHVAADFMDRHRMTSDGGAPARAVDEILALIAARNADGPGRTAGAASQRRSAAGASGTSG
jgi:hypothetical protein